MVPDFSGILGLWNSEDLTGYRIIYTAVYEKPEVLFKCLKTLVGERGFEPPTPWSGTQIPRLIETSRISLFLIDWC